MKTINLVILLGFFVVFAQAQNQDYKNNISLQTGFSATGTLLKAADWASNAIGTQGVLDFYHRPVFQLAYDRSVLPWLSIGGAVSYQNLGVDILNRSFEINNNLVFENAQIDIKRYNYAVRVAGHYGKLSRFDFYSALRLGITSWNVDVNTSDALFDIGKYINFADRFIGTNFAPQLVYFGARGYFTDNIGANVELSVGAPYYATLGLNYRF